MILWYKSGSHEKITDPASQHARAQSGKQQQWFDAVALSRQYACYLVSNAGFLAKTGLPHGSAIVQMRCD